jgi:serine/threonine-protein kinase
MAEVFAGYAVGDHGFQKPVAIKRLLPELANDEVFVDRLIEEAKLLVGMQHGQIVSVLDLAREGDDVFLVMEFVDGPSLRQLIKARGARGLSLGVATYIVQAAAAGLEFAHARPGGAIIHADISPSNLLLTTSGEVRVADFGIARREGLGHGVVEGKWAYMAPEQARGEALTPRSDVFALGVVLYELLTGQHPFGRAVTANERDDQMRVIPPRVVKPAIPPGLDAICMRALAHDARDRYGRMQQLIDALVEERFTNGYREGAADLAQAIREVAPRSDVGAPRTMHTDRPVTIVTRSLLPPDMTPNRRPSATPLPPRRPSATPLPPAPTTLPPSGEFPVVPTMGVATIARAVEPPPEEFPAMPTMGVMTTPLPAPPPPDAFPAIPSSGAQTVAREVDQFALAQAAQAAAAMLQLPPALRADGTPMPPFRVSHPDMRGNELASVVGGHTLTGHAASVAVEVRGHRWTIGVLGAAALIGVIAAVVIQSSPSASADEMVRVPAKIEPGATQPKPAEARPDEASVPHLPPPQPTITESPKTAPADPSATQPSGAPGADAANAAQAGDRKAGDGWPSSGNADGPGNDRGNGQVAGQGAANRDGQVAGQTSGPVAGNGDGQTNGGPVAANGDGKVNDGRGDGTAVAKADNPNDGKNDGKVSDGGTSGSRTGSTRTRDGGRGTDRGDRGNKKTVAGKEPGKRRGVSGILAVQSTPWSWVTVDVETKETPAKFYLSPGTHIVKLYNQDNGLTKYEKVVIEADKLVKLNERMSEDAELR